MAQATATIDASELGATLTSMMSAANYAGWDTSVNSAFTGYGVAAICFGAAFMQRKTQNDASMAFKIFFICTGIGFGLAGATTQIMNSNMEDGKIPGMKLGDDNSLHLIFWMGASLIAMGAAAMMVAANITGNGGAPKGMLSMIAYIAGIGATAMGVLTNILEEPILLDFIKMTMNEAMIRLMPALFALGALILACKGQFTKTGAPGNNMIAAAASLYSGAGLYISFGVPDDCAIPKGPLRDLGSCPFPADFNEYAILHCCIIIASIFMFLAGKSNGAEEANMASVVIPAPEAGPAEESD